MSLFSSRSHGRALVNGMTLRGASSLRAWPYCPPPVEGELLSAFLVRAAGCHGLSPQWFCAFHFPGLAIWNRDIDRVSSCDFVKRVAEFSGVSVDAVRAMTLGRYEARFSAGHKSGSGVAPWINAVGVYHRLRLRFGLQYCPLCLGNFKTFITPWRLSFNVICPTHSCLLLDSCPRCRHPVVPHRTGQRIDCCYQCGFLLSEASAPALPENKIQLLSQIRQQALDCGVLANVTIGNRVIPADEFVLGLRCIIGALRITRVFSRAAIQDSGKEQFELMKTESRLHVVETIASVIDRWPEGFLAVSAAHGINQRHLEMFHLPPQWLSTVATELPLGEARPRSRQKITLRKKLIAIQRRKADGWRAKRAEVLLANVSKRRGV